MGSCVPYRPISPATSPPSNFQRCRCICISARWIAEEESCLVEYIQTPMKNIPGSLPIPVIIQSPFSIAISFIGVLGTISQCFKCKGNKSAGFKPIHQHIHLSTHGYRKSKLNLKTSKLNKEHYCCIINYLISKYQSQNKYCKSKWPGQIEKNSFLQFLEKKASYVIM